MSVRCMPTSCSGSQFDKVPRTSWGSVFALARVCTAPMQPHYFTHYYLRMFVRTSSLTLDAMCVCVRARVCQGSTRSRRPLGGRFSPLHASPARRCTRVRSPTDYYACPCAHVQRHSMKYVCACVQMAYRMLCAHGNLHAGAVQRVQRGSVFALPRVPSAPVQPRAFTHLSLRIFMRVS